MPVKNKIGFLGRARFFHQIHIISEYILDGPETTRRYRNEEETEFINSLVGLNYEQLRIKRKFVEKLIYRHAKLETLLKALKESK